MAALPVAVLLGSIAFLKIRIHSAALLGLVVALAIALFGFRMPFSAAIAAAGFGAAYGSSQSVTSYPPGQVVPSVAAVDSAFGFHLRLGACQRRRAT